MPIEKKMDVVSTSSEEILELMEESRSEFLDMQIHADGKTEEVALEQAGVDDSKAWTSQDTFEKK